MSQTAEEATMAQIVQAVASGKCILFLGAGVHFPPREPDSPYLEKYPAHVRPPLGKELAEILAAESGLAASNPEEMQDIRNLARIATFCEFRSSRQRVIETVRKAVGIGKHPSAAVRALAELDFPLVITTNYDHLFERASVMANRSPRLGVYDPDGQKPTTDFLEDPDPEQPFVFKIHGDIDQSDSIVLTDEDYIHFSLRMGDRAECHPLPETFRVAIKRRPTLFIGYRLVDYNLRLLFKTLHWKLDKSKLQTAYSVDPYPDPLILEQFGRRDRSMQFIAQDLWRFVPELYRRIKGKEMPL